MFVSKRGFGDSVGDNGSVGELGGVFKMAGEVADDEPPTDDFRRNLRRRESETIVVRWQSTEELG